MTDRKARADTNPHAARASPGRVDYAVGVRALATGFLAPPSGLTPDRHERAIRVYEASRMVSRTFAQLEPHRRMAQAGDGASRRRLSRGLTRFYLTVRLREGLRWVVRRRPDVPGAAATRRHIRPAACESVSPCSWANERHVPKVRAWPIAANACWRAGSRMPLPLMSTSRAAQR